jgi:CHAT domain
MYLKSRDNLPLAWPKLASRDYSRLCCGGRDTQLDLLLRAAAPRRNEVVKGVDLGVKHFESSLAVDAVRAHQREVDEVMDRAEERTDRRRERAGRAVAGADHPSEPRLLTASEVAQLKLNADWVVLSACNTAAGDKPGAEALSGLARAFFYAGARALLVSHWARVRAHLDACGAACGRRMSWSSGR